jgi:hypothetical protein
VSPNARDTKAAISDTLDMAREELAKGHRIAAREAAMTAAREAKRYGHVDLQYAATLLYRETEGAL